VSSTAELYKNREADMGNPNFNNFNIYHTIDEEKVSKSVEHLYDEIKHKNKDYGTYSVFMALSLPPVGIATTSFCLTKQDAHQIFHEKNSFSFEFLLPLL
jgi:hypothetical protein